jgi:sulfatase modifying factor 1
MSRTSIRSLRKLVMKYFHFIISCLFFTVAHAQKHKEVDLKMLLPASIVKQLAYIPGKTFTSLSFTGSDSVSTYKPRASSVRSFYISRAEVTNREYREFVNYVKDSLAHHLMGHLKNGAIDWEQPIDWRDSRLEALRIKPEDDLFGQKQTDPGKIVFAFDFYGKSETISIYPDTLVWIRDFHYSYNEPLVKRYFSGSEYDHYPVVGVNLKQAMAFCQWKTAILRSLLKKKESDILARLPSNAEWESAAVEGKDSLVRISKNKVYDHNFGNIVDGSRITIKTYNDDGHFYTSPVKTYRPGPYGLYDMKGNIAEWTRTSMEEVINTEIKEEKTRSIFVVKGGSWNSTPYYLQAGVCQFVKAEETHSYLGFRYIVEIR